MRPRKPFKRHCRRCNKMFYPYGRTNFLCESCNEKSKKLKGLRVNQKPIYNAQTVAAYFKAQWEKKQKRKGLNTTNINK